MSAIYRIELSANHYATALARFRRQNPRYWRQRLIQTLALAFAVGAVIFAALTGSRWRGTVLWMSLGALSAAATLALLQRVAISNIVRRTSTFGESIQITLDDSGARSMSSGGSNEVEWTAFTRAAKFADGFVLSQGSHDSWLPHAALSASTPIDVERLLRAKVASFVWVAH